MVSNFFKYDFWQTDLQIICKIRRTKKNCRPHEIGLGLGLWCLIWTFNIISVISWQSLLLVEETEYPEKTTDLPQVTDKLHHIMLYQEHLTWAGFKLATLVVIGTDCISSCKSHYHTIMTTKVPPKLEIYLNKQIIIAHVMGCFLTYAH